MENHQDGIYVCKEEVHQDFVIAVIKDGETISTHREIADSAKDAAELIHEYVKGYEVRGIYNSPPPGSPHILKIRNGYIHGFNYLSPEEYVEILHTLQNLSQE